MDKISCFLRRIGMPGARVALNADFLGQVTGHAVTHIPYENLDVLAGKALQLDDEALYEKIVTRGRGGYCFELNGLLTYMLSEMGFTVSERFARFLLGEKDVPMRRHRVTVVHMADGDYLCDIGVGIVAPRLPLKIEENTVQEQNGESYRFTRDRVHGWVMWELHHGEWREYICFNDEKAFPVDFVQPSFYCEKHPDSPFNKEYMLSIKTDEGRKTLDGRCYKEFNGENLVHIEENITDARAEELFKNTFLLSL